MFKLLPAALAFILELCLGTASAQLPVEYFELTPPKHKYKVAGSLYRQIEFMDSRPDSLLIGPIQTGPFNNLDARLVERVEEVIVDAE